MTPSLKEPSTKESRIFTRIPTCNIHLLPSSVFGGQHHRIIDADTVQAERGVSPLSILVKQAILYRKPGWILTACTIGGGGSVARRVLCLQVQAQQTQQKSHAPPHQHE